MSRTLYDSANEHDSCGVGFVANTQAKASNDIVRMGVQVLRNLVHRGAFGSDPETGDGAGMMFQLPHQLFVNAEYESPVRLPAKGDYGVGMAFLPRSEKELTKCRRTIELVVKQEGEHFLGWRTVPVDSDRLGRLARETEPTILQFLVGRSKNTPPEEFERRLFVIRKVIEQQIHGETGISEDHIFFVCSLSSRTIVYKGLMLPDQVEAYYQDLQNPDFVSTFALVHQRFSTNTMPSWPLAHPYRLIAHNGEINTISSNRRWMHAREMGLRSAIYGDDLKKLFPLVSMTGSDSLSFDNAAELLTFSGMTLPQAMMALVPEAWEAHDEMTPEVRDFYEYMACCMEPWDGPAAICFCDGRVVGGILDRNGLRPARYTMTRDGFIVCASETGVIEFPPERIAHAGRLKPGEVFLLDLDSGKRISNDEAKQEVARRHPYGEWLRQGQTVLDEITPAPHPTAAHPLPLNVLQRLFGMTQEDIDIVMGPMMKNGEEATGSMGNDTPAPPFSHRALPLFNYFRQLFAQVTNPAIDPIREKLVMSLTDSIGRDGSVLDTRAENARQVRILSPVLTEENCDKLRHAKELELPLTVKVLSAVFDVREPEGALQRALVRLCREASYIAESGADALILSDREVSADFAPIPTLLAVSAVHNHLTRMGVRAQLALVIESGEPREVHHFACLVAYGASSICPYVALQTCMDADPEHPDKAVKNFIKAVDKGLLKVMSKMGISTLRSYRGSQLFEAIGLSSAFIDEYFTGTTSRIEGLTINDVEREYRTIHATAFDPLVEKDLDVGGVYQWRRFGEYHAINPTTVTTLQHAVRRHSYSTFEEFADAVHCSDDYACEIRGLLEIVPVRPAVKLQDVEPAQQIVKRFTTGAMSLGSISREAHETLAKALNAIGGRSNSGEGGEDPERYGDDRRSAIKQVASGRFGVTTSYLVNADELQIKIAQGAKPGEGGQLPGNKVDEYIGRIRHTTPGVTLISPPPHHDIYSIEDLAQLIHDLHSVNPKAAVSVKLVSEVGVGTIAAGVVKADAQHVLISGSEGGTGASPLTSIKYAGLPWELGIAETQQTLVRNGLRSRVRLQVDGQLKTGRDVVVAALLGADEYGFATAPLVAQGCIMMRVCHLGTCPVGIATQDPELRKKFTGKPEHVINYFFFVAEQVRRIMAELGYRTMDDMIGQVQCLRPNDSSRHWKTRGLDFSALLEHLTPVPGDDLRYVNRGRTFNPAPLEHSFLNEVKRALDEDRMIELSAQIRNSDRSFGALISGEIARRKGDAGLASGTVRIHLKGSAGQSFGAFLAQGVELDLTGDTNDYVGKGMTGGRIVVKFSPVSKLDSTECTIAGNTLLYGAIGGEAYFGGCVGERFAVRNSGAMAVVEGVGDHACEYMTGGTVVVLGTFGRNFGAGMSGGMALVFDPKGLLPKRLNKDSKLLIEPIEDEALLCELIARHAQYTESAYARHLLKRWSAVKGKFVQVVSEEYKALVAKQREKQEVSVG